MGLLDRETGAGEPWVSLWLRGEHCSQTPEAGFSVAVPAPGSLRARGHREAPASGVAGAAGGRAQHSPSPLPDWVLPAAGRVSPTPTVSRGPSGQ